MQPSKEQIENAARLVQEQIAEIEDIGVVHKCMLRYWKPWADTEAGRSDALVLLAAVFRWHATYTVSGKLPRPLTNAMISGNVQQIQAAAFAAAAAIGEHMKGVEG